MINIISIDVILPVITKDVDRFQRIASSSCSLYVFPPLTNQVQVGNNKTGKLMNGKDAPMRSSQVTASFLN